MRTITLFLALLASSSVHALSRDFWRELERTPAELVLFHEIAKIYRPSGGEEGVRALIKQLAKQAKTRAWAGQKITIKEDGKKNVLLRLPGRGKFARGFRPVGLQAHLDMIISTVDEISLARMKTHGVDVVETDGWLHSRGNRTTLGADNGAGLALALKYLVDPLEDQMPLEILLTVQEENGMHGAKELGHVLSAGCLINLDWDQVGIIGHACTGAEMIIAGGNLKPEHVTFEPGDVVIDVALYKLPGGHSGIDIAENRPNAAIFAASILREALQGPPTYLLSFEAGESGKLNTIPSEARARLVTSAQEATELEARLKRAFSTSPHRQKSARFDVERFSIDEAFATGRLREGDQLFASADRRSEDYLSAFVNIPNGPLSPRPSFPTWETSSSLGFARIHDARLDFGVMLRSFDKDDARTQGDLLRAFIAAHPYLENSRLSREFNPGWSADTSTFLYAAGLAADPSYRLSVAPGGLELTPLSLRLGPIPVTSIGPNIKDLHAVTERLEVKSFLATQIYLSKFLSRLADCSEMLLAH